MFKALKEKLTSWFKKPAEEEEKEEAEEKEEKAEKKSEKTAKKAEKKAKKPEKKEKKEGKEKAKKGREEKKEKVRKEKAEKKEEEKKEEKEVEKEAKKEELKAEETWKDVAEVAVEKVEEKKEEKKPGFFKRLFGKREETIEEIEKKEKEKIEKEEEKLKEEINELEQKEKQGQQQDAVAEVKEEKTGFFGKLARKLSISTLTQEQFDELFPELEFILLENNVALEVVDKIHDELSKDLVGIEIKKSEIQETIINSLKEIISNILIEPPDLLEQIKKKLSGPFTIIFVGINGSGKTTSIAKVAHLLKEKGISCVLAAGDTFRAASIEQLKTHAERLSVPIIAHQYGADPAAVAFDAIKYAEAHNIKAVLIDTAGRMYTKTNLIKEMEKIVRISKPDLKIFVGEAITGNDATVQSRTFNEAINISGIILTKSDVDEKGGAILSVSQVTGKPIYFLGTGQEYSDLTPFTKKNVLKSLGLG